MIFRSESLLRLTLGIAREVARDYRAVSGGGKQMPSATEIVEHVYSDVVLPAMEHAVASSLGIVGRPLLWVCRRTIGGGVRYLLTRIKTDAIEQTGTVLALDSLVVRYRTGNATPITAPSCTCCFSRICG